jgi:hypothetical protein
MAWNELNSHASVAQITLTTPTAVITRIRIMEQADAPRLNLIPLRQ